MKGEMKVSVWIFEKGVVQSSTWKSTLAGPSTSFRRPHVHRHTSPVDPTTDRIKHRTTVTDQGGPSCSHSRTPRTHVYRHLRSRPANRHTQERARRRIDLQDLWRRYVPRTQTPGDTLIRWIAGVFYTHRPFVLNEIYIVKIDSSPETPETKVLRQTPRNKNKVPSENKNFQTAVSPSTHLTSSVSSDTLLEGLSNSDSQRQTK